MSLQTDLLDAITEFHRTNRYSPTVRELLGLLDIRSTSTIHRALLSLRDQGLIEWSPHQYRTIRPTRATD